MRQLNYRIYPSLLDSFQGYLDCEANYEKFFGQSEEPSLTYSEYEQKTFKELIDRINRVPFDSDAADKGSCFNEIVDCIILRTKSTRSDIVISRRDTITRAVGHGVVNPANGVPVGGDVEIQEYNLPHLEAVMGNKVFRFDIPFVKSAASYFKGALPQTYTEAVMDTRYGNVLLYGFVDYIREDVVYDAKTTSRYEFGKYRKGWQQHLYPWALIESGKCSSIRCFEYTAFNLKGGTERSPLIKGDMYTEAYMYDHKRSEGLLRGIVEQFIEFVENNRELITDRRIFGEVAA